MILIKILRFCYTQPPKNIKNELLINLVENVIICLFIYCFNKLDVFNRYDIGIETP
jgi:hypothetical protein